MGCNCRPQTESEGWNTEREVDELPDRSFVPVALRVPGI